MEDGSEFTIFRHISRYPVIYSKQSCVFIVRFKFKYFSHKINKLISIIPMLLITGYPGFVSKCYAVNSNNGYWQGMYQWKSLNDLESYKKSFIFRMMNKRAISETMVSQTVIHQTLDGFLNQNSKQIEEIYLDNFPTREI